MSGSAQRLSPERLSSDAAAGKGSPAVKLDRTHDWGGTEAEAQQAISALFHNMRQSAIVLTMFPLLLLNVLWEQVDHGILLAWVVAAFVVALYRWLLYFNRQRADISRGSGRLWVRAAFVSAMLSGVVWGSTAPLFFPDVSADAVIVANIIMVGLAAGSAVASNYWLPYFYAFVIPGLSSYGLYYLSRGGVGEFTLAGLYLVYLVMLSNMAGYMHRTHRENLRLRLKNENLVGELQQKKDIAEASSRAKTRFLAAASHDLRQPVHSISLLRETLILETDKSRRMELLALMGHAVDALDQLLGSLLDISRLDAGVIDTRVEPVPLQALIDSLLGEVRPLAWDKGLQLRTRRGEHMILSDPGLLTNILRNLLTNAIRYTEQGGVLIACRRRGKNLLLQVWDSGIGIDATDHQQIFQEFTQLNNPERDRNKGLGLGLAICRRMSVLLGHHLSVRSMPRRGTVFSIEVPLYDGTVLPTAEGATAPVQRDLRGRRVLVLEDDETVRLGMVALLEHWGCRVLAAASVEMALQMARQAAFQIDAMVSDYRLPGDTTGVEAMAAIMQEARGTIPVVLITGDTSPQRIQEAKLSGFPLLHKPVKPAFLRNALGRAMQAVE